MIQIDHIVPPLRSGHYTAILVAICCYSRYVIAKPVTSQTAKRTAKFLLNDVFYPLSFFPRVICSDQGKGFTSRLMEELTELLQIKQVFTSGYMPQSNGIVERVNKSIGDAISFFTNEHQNDWHLYVEAACFAVNCSVSVSTGYTPIELCFNRKAILPIDINMSNIDQSVMLNAEQIRLMNEFARNRIKALQQKNKRLYDAKHQPVDFAVGDEVLVEDLSKSPDHLNKFAPRFLGPFKILEVLQNSTVRVDGPINNNIVNISKLKKYKRRPGSDEHHFTPRVSLRPPHIPIPQTTRAQRAEARARRAEAGSDSE